MSDPFDIPLETLRRRTSAKWSRVGKNALPLWVAEMDVELAPAITQRCQEAIALGDTGYSGDTTAMREAFANFAQSRWGWGLDAQECYTYPELSMCGAELMAQFAGIDGRVIITPPVYNSFYQWAKAADVELVEVPLKNDPYGAPDLDAIDAAFADGVPAILISQPHNPYGRLWTREELMSLAASAHKHGAKVISDEIHAPLTYPGEEFVPFLSVSDEARACGVALHSASKAWNTPGLKASIVVRDENGPTFKRSDETDWMLGNLGVCATEEAFKNSVEWLDTVCEQLVIRRDHIEKRLSDALPDVRMSHPEAGYLMWLDMRDVLPGLDEPGAYIHEKTDLFLAEGNKYGAIGAGHVRLNFATSMTILDDALDRIISACTTYEVS